MRENLNWLWLMKQATIICLLGLLVTACGVRETQPTRLQTWPLRFLWAWERPEQLDFLDPRTTGVAYLAQTIALTEDKTIVRPRLQPLSVPPQTVIVAVTRIESDRRAPPVLSDAQRAATVTAIVKTLERPNIAGVQIDFDATLTERAFYRALLQDVRRALPSNVALSMTALASWCIGDDWLTGLPVDEAVPMLFRMGVEQSNVRSYLQSGQDFRAALCRTSYGVATDEPINNLPRNRRYYIFHPQSWTPEAAQRALAAVQ